jgi:hypothetical protein
MTNKNKPRMIQIQSLCGSCGKLHEMKGAGGICIVFQEPGEGKQTAFSFCEFSIETDEELFGAGVSFIGTFKQQHPEIFSDVMDAVNKEEFKFEKNELETKPSN